MRITFFVFILFFSLHFSLSGQDSDLYINEIVADNAGGIQDEFKDFSDWIELYNSGASAINLKGYSLTDDPNDSAKWKFPNFSLSPEQYLHVFASGRNLFSLPVIWFTEVDWGDEWKYIIPDAATPANWNTLNFIDTGWNTGISGFGYGDDDDSTFLSEGTISVYLRTSFSIDNIQNIERGLLHIDYDDAFVAYLNGAEIGRANIGTPGTEVVFDQLALNTDHEAKLYSGGKPDMFIIKNIRDYLVEGVNIFAVEVHNAGASSSDLTAIPFLTLGYADYTGEAYTNKILDLPGSSIHTNFKLSRGGEFLGLYDPEGNVVDTLTFDSQSPNISYGRSSINPSVWGYFVEPTPASKNGEISFDFSKRTVFSIPGGFYTGPQFVSLAVEGSSTSIYFTLDGTTPDLNSILYTTPISLDSTSVVRARTFGNIEIPSEIVTQTYFINEDVNLPFISIVTNPDNLFSDESGIYVTGTNGKRGSCDATIRNLNQDWERPVNLELYNKSGEMILNQIAGIKIFGGCSRTRYPQKSFSLFARSEYGKGSFKGQLFPDKEIYKFEAFILRSSADDQTKTMIKDAFAHYVQIEHMDIDYQAYRPTVVFINGAYWGIHNMREKINEHYLAGNFGVDPDDVNILQGGGSEVFGDGTGYHAMVDFAASNDMTDPENYKYIQSKMNVNQYIDYQIANIYLAEVDWPGNNIKFWNSNNQNYNKWRWITFDRDQTFLSYRIQTDALALATAIDAPGWPNPPWSTLLFRRMLTNKEFRNKFIQIYAYHMNMTFDADRIFGFVDSFKAGIEDEIPRHIERWGGQVDPEMNESWTAPPTFNTIAEWESNLREIKSFAEQRPAYVVQHINKKFGLAGLVSLDIGLNNNEAGKVKIYHKEIPYGGYSGDHFRDVPLKIKAISKSGFQFSHWTISTTEGEEMNEMAIIEITLTSPTILTAHFVDKLNNSDPLVLINEINYNSPVNKNPGDWVELYNNSGEVIDLENWQLKDEDDQHVFTFMRDMELNPHKYLVICESVDDFITIFPDVDNRIGDLGFKFSNSGEVIRLYDDNGILIDSVRYDDAKPWPELPDGSGPTLELIHPDLDNDLPGSWTASTQSGTPGRVNHTITGQPPLVMDSNEQISLYTNYPNPVITSTIISYSIDNPGHVILKIIDIMGNELETMVNSYQKPNTYSVNFNAGNLANGVYLYVLQVDHVPVNIRRMVVDH